MKFDSINQDSPSESHTVCHDQIKDKSWNLQSNELLAFNALELLTEIAAIWLHFKFAAAWVHQMPLNSEPFKSLGEHLHSTCGQKSQRKRHAKCDHNSRCLSQNQKKSSQNCVQTVVFIYLLIVQQQNIHFSTLFFFSFLSHESRRIASFMCVSIFAYAGGEPTLAAHHSRSDCMWRSVFCMCRVQYLCVRHFSIVLFLLNFFAFSRRWQ